MILPLLAIRLPPEPGARGGRFSPPLDLWRDTSSCAARTATCAPSRTPAAIAAPTGRRRQLQAPHHLPLISASSLISWTAASAVIEKTLPRHRQGQAGLKELELEVFCGLVFVRIAASIAEQWQHTDGDSTATGVQISRDCNWKVAQLPRQLPCAVRPSGLHRLMDNDLVPPSTGTACRCTSANHVGGRSGLSAPGAARLRQGRAEAARDTWVFGFMPVNIGFDVFPDSMDIFQILPKGATKSVIRTPLFVRPDARREAKVMHYLANRIDIQIGHEDEGSVRAGGPLQPQLPAGAALRIRDAGEGHACAAARAACPVVTLNDGRWMAPCAGSTRSCSPKSMPSPRRSRRHLDRHCASRPVAPCLARPGAYFPIFAPCCFRPSFGVPAAAHQ